MAGGRRKRGCRVIRPLITEFTLLHPRQRSGEDSTTPSNSTPSPSVQRPPPLQIPSPSVQPPPPLHIPSPPVQPPPPLQTPSPSVQPPPPLQTPSPSVQPPPPPLQAPSPSVQPSPTVSPSSPSMQPLPTVQPPDARASTSTGQSPAAEASTSTGLLSAEDSTATLPDTPLGRDSTGRIIVSVSEFKTFTNGVPHPSRWFTRHLSKWNFVEFWPVFTKIDKDILQAWWLEFKRHYAWPGYPDAVAREAFWIMMSDRYKSFIHHIKDDCFPSRTNPGYFQDDVWERWLVHWASDTTVERSQRAKRNRCSTSGVGSKHTSGSISVAEHIERMKRAHGDGVTHCDIFALTHTTLVDPDQPPQWIDSRAETTFSTYRTRVQSEVDEGRLEADQGEKTPWCPEIWKDVANEGHKKRGPRVYGFGDYGATAILPAPPSEINQNSPSTARSHYNHTVGDERYQHILEENARIHAENERILAESERTRMEVEQARLESEQARLESEQARLESEQTRANQERMQAELYEFMNSFRCSNPPSSQG